MIQKSDGPACRGLEKRMLGYLVQKELAGPGDHVIAGVSGGADSVCLLLLLDRLKDRVGYTLSAVHVEHVIRGEESLRDAAFAEELCGRLGVACTVYHVCVPEYAASHKMGEEEAARVLRYDCLKKEAQAYPGRRVRIALAHHADDNAETVLFWLARGSGLKGSGGIRPKRELIPDVTVIRPLLFAQREEILRELAGRGQTYCEDGTNAQLAYSRNRIRHEILPQLRRINPQAAAHIAACAETMSELSDYLEEETARILPSVCVRLGEETGGPAWLLLETLTDYPAVLEKAVIYRVLCEAAGSSRDIGSVHVEAVLDFFRHQTGQRLSLPYRTAAERVCEGIRIRRIMPGKENEKGESIGAAGEETAEHEILPQKLEQLERGETIAVRLPDGVLQLRLQRAADEICRNISEIPKKKYTKWLDYDKIKNSLQIRTRRSGDYLTIDGEGHRKKLKEYLVGEKIPAKQRDHIWLLTEGAHVIWVIGGRISAGVKVTKDTRRVLEVRMVLREEISAGCLNMEDEDED